MEKSVSCRTLGIDCDFEMRVPAGSEVLTTVMRHVLTAHALDWFELEEVHAKLRSLLGGTAVAEGGPPGRKRRDGEKGRGRPHLP